MQKTALDDGKNVLVVREHEFCDTYYCDARAICKKCGKIEVFIGENGSSIYYGMSRPGNLIFQ